MGLAIILLSMSTAYFASGGTIKLNSPTVHNHSHQEQFQGQLMINMFLQKGNKLRWQIESCNKESGKTEVDILNVLHPTSSYFAKITKTENTCNIIYPIFLEEKE